MVSMTNLMRCVECGTLLPSNSPAWKTMCIYCYKDKKQAERNESKGRVLLVINDDNNECDDNLATQQEDRMEREADQANEDFYRSLEW